MHPKSTEYRLATSDDMVDIYEHFDITERIGWPVVVAVREDKVVGFLGTQDRTDTVAAGPLEINLENKAFVCLRLVEGYDRVMRSMGLKHYWFSVDETDAEKWLQQVQELGLYTKIDQTGDHAWYRRDL